MSLLIDIKANDEFKKSILEASAALERVANHEKNINKISDKIGTSFQKTGAHADKLAKTVKKLGGETGKEANGAKKSTDEKKKQTKEGKAGLSVWTLVTGSIVAAGAAAIALGAEVAKLAYDAAASKKEAGALLDAFTADRGPKAMEMLDGLASQLGLTFDETRSKFVEFRQAGLDNKMSANLIKMRADLMALGLSAAAADKEISTVTAAGSDRFAAARAFNELSRAYKGAGDGAKGAAFATTSVVAAQNKLTNVATEELAGLWKEIGPAIGKSAHMVADFAIKLIKSEEGQAAIKAVGDAFKAIPEIIGTGIAFIKENKEVITGVGNAILATADAIYTVANVAVMTVIDIFDGVGKAMGWAASEVSDGVDWIVDAFNDVIDLPSKMADAGAAIVDGLVGGITSRISAAADAALDLAKNIAGPFAKALGIQSPSKLFADYGANTVAGFERGEKQEIAGKDMPLQAIASEAPAVPRSGGASAPGGAPSGGGDGGGGITIQNLIVQGGGNPDAIARSIRQELQLLLQAGALSRGLA